MPNRKLLKLLGIVIVLSHSSCGGKASPVRPHATLAESFLAEAAFHKLESQWATATPNERLELGPELEEFLRQFPNDPKARLASLYLAWVVLEKGDVARAKTLVDKANPGDPGAVSDFAQVMRAALLLESKKSAAALAELELVRDKIIDPIERFICNELLVEAALTGQNPDKVTRYMLHLLVQAPEAQKDVAKEKLKTWLGQMQARALEHAFVLVSRDERASNTNDRERARAVTWMLATLRQYLTARAIGAKDTALAQRLLDNFVPEGTSDALTDLAATGQYTPRVLGRSVGLVLELQTSLQSQRSSEVARGMIQALGLLRNEAEQGPVQLKTRPIVEGHDGITTALEQLSSDGASLLVAGVSDETANLASEFAEAEGIPTILLRRPTAPAKTTAMSFVLGENDAAVETELRQWLSKRGITEATRIAQNDGFCSPDAASQNGFPLATWRQDRVAALLLLAAEGCGRALIEDLKRARLEPLLLFGLDASRLRPDYPHSVTIKSGLFPDQLPEDGNPHGSEVIGWYRALGHDAAVLAHAALVNLPPSLTTDPRQVATLKQSAARELRSARVPLWTTNSRGFTQASQIERHLATIAGE